MVAQTIPTRNLLGKLGHKQKGLMRSGLEGRELVVLEPLASCVRAWSFFSLENTLTRRQGAGFSSRSPSIRLALGGGHVAQWVKTCRQAW